MFILKWKVGCSLEEIDGMDVERGARWATMALDEETARMMIQRIDIYASQGIDVTDPAKSGTDVFKKYIDRKNKERDKSIKEKMGGENAVKEREIRTDPELEAKIKEMQRQKSDVRKT